MNLTPRWASYLSAAGYHADHWSSIGSAEEEDSAICRYARENRCIVLTNDLDFPQILACTGSEGPSLILLRGHPLVPESRGAHLLLVLANYAQELDSGALITVDWLDRVRIRVLPLQ